MKKLIITFSIVLSGFACAQSSDDNPYLYDEPSPTEGDTFPGNPGDPNAAPVDQYIPALFVLAITIILGASTKKDLDKAKSR
ncbi:hypothetical protein [Chryseobacterium luquanense]|uniref:Signal peptidase n=1 Tax=Chryseobacterium luquanense TaxID=2983766 RepID=A0ABT3Y081_9FLAO|nr:hypothetical protein [Chryseobacterium luquanense]MCX8531545.1 hypothetical protein [Chryseobacterium luquanense]